MPLTGGSVTYGETKNLGDYNSRKAEATIGYDDPADIQKAQAVAVQAVSDMLAGNIVVRTEPKAAEPKAKKELKPKKAPEPEQEPVDVFGDSLEAVDVFHEKEAPKAAISSGEDRVEPAAAEDDLFDAVATAAPISDKDLTDAANRKNKSLRDAAEKEGTDLQAASNKIRLLIGKFVKPPKRIQDIDASVRADFLTQLDALK
jgi:hypothetical protein